MLRMTMFFATDNYTWTESHWFSALTSYAAGVAPAQAIAAARNNLLGDYASIVAIRLTNPALPRTSFYLPPANLPSPTAGPFQGNSQNTTTADRPYSAVLAEYTGSDASQAVRFTRSAALRPAVISRIGADNSPCRVPCWKSYNCRAR